MTDDPGTPGTGATSGTAPATAETADARGSSGTPGSAAPGATTPGSATPGAAGPHSRPRARKRRRWLRVLALTASVAVLAAAGVGYSLYKKLDGNIRTDVSTENELRRHEADRPVKPAPSEDSEEAPAEVQNILLLGSDSRSGSNGKYGRDGGGQRSDTAILLHIAADRSSATGVSIPRDLMTDIPACEKRGGGRTEARFAQFNSAFQTGGAACTIRTVEKMTGIRIDHHLIVDFSGFKKLVDAVEGVEVCLPEAVKDTDAKLDLPAGRQTLFGEDALGYVRARHALGNGSDTQRMDRQQQFLGSLVKKMRSNGVLLNPAKLYPVLDSATSALTADSGLDSLTELYELVRSVRNIPEGDVRFLTVPRQSYELDINRDELVQPEADRLFEQLRQDRPVRVKGDGDGGGDKADIADAKPGEQSENGNEKASPSESGSGHMSDASGEPSDDDAPTYRGTTAARDICAADTAGNGVN
ncbi:LCP family protein [Streptomyces daliensis]